MQEINNGTLLFSIIIPVYNIEKYIAECISSIIAQVKNDSEIILVDDGSTDSSGRICDEYESKYSFIKTYHKQNGGLSDARNYGIDKAQGKYLVYVDGDDYIHSETLNWLRTSILSNNEKTPDVILSEGIYEVVDNTISSKKFFNANDFNYISGETALSITLPIRSNWTAWGKCYRTEFWREKDFFFKRNRVCEDMQLIDRVVLEAECVCMIPAYTYYRYRPTSLAHEISPNFVNGVLDNIEEWIEYLEQDNQTHSKIKQLLLRNLACCFLHSVMAYVYLLSCEYRDAILPRIKKNISLLKMIDSSESKLVRVIVSVCGIRCGCWCLAQVKKYRINKEYGNRID